MQRNVVRKQPNSRMCFVCGLENEYGLKSRFYELDDGQLVAVFNTIEEHQSYPGRVHGGIAATILDETIGRAIMNSRNDNIWGVTLDFSMKLRKPLPLGCELRVVARIVSETKRGFSGEGEILLEDGQVAVSATGKYLKMPIEKIADFDHQGADWRVITTEDDPLTLDVPDRD